MRIIKLFLISVLVFGGCTQKMTNPEELPLARVYDEYLYVSDLENIIPQNLTEIDSLALLKDYIEKWVQKQLILVKAEENLTEAEKDVQKQINEYRTSLLIFKYEQNLIQQKLDTVITKEEIEEYYKENSSNFILNNSIVKGIYIKVPRNAPDLWRLRRWYKSHDEEDIKKLDAYCFQNAKEVEYFENDWVQFDKLLTKLPKMGSSPRSLIEKRNIEARDSLYLYFIRIDTSYLEGKVAPMEYVEHNIKSIVLNKRKIQYINRLEADIYNDALNRGNFNIY